MRPATGNPGRDPIAKRCSGGFTLIELLVVVAVLSMLLAILLPALTKARLNAKRVACKSNLRQITFAWHLYLGDSEGRFYQRPNANLEFGGWQGQRMQGQVPVPRPLNPYLGLSPTIATQEEAKGFCCPADRGGVPGYGIHLKVYLLLGCSYHTNIFLIGQSQVLVLDDLYKTLHEEINKRLGVLTLVNAYNPTRLVLVGDYGWVNQWESVSHPREDWKELAEWHGRCCHHNLAFLDGHVEFVHVRKGLYVGSDYSVVPFRDLTRLAYTSQQAQICPKCGR